MWREIATRWDVAGDGALATASGQAMNGRCIGDTATVALTVEEQLRVTAVLQDWVGESDLD
jgi:hypothetical protein